MKTIFTTNQPCLNKYVSENQVAGQLAFCTMQAGFIVNCVFHPFLKGNSKVADFSIAFSFYQKEGALC